MEWTPVTGGKSGARVWRGAGVHRKQDTAARVAAEAARLAWLGEQGIPCPRVVDVDGDVLVTTTLPGSPAVGRPTHQWPRLVSGLAEVLRALHALPTAQCSYQEGLDVTVPRALAAAEAGLVDLTDLDAVRSGWRLDHLVAELLRTRPTYEDLVVCHGDPGMTNVLFDDDGVLTGLLDVGGLGVADRYRDLAIVARSVGDRLSPPTGEHLLRLLVGEHVDRERLAFYALLDEFF